MIEPIEMNVDFSTQDTEINVEADMNCKVEIPLPIASATTLGGIKVGENLSITEDGTLSADANADDVDQLKNALIVNNASGSIASFPDGGDGFPVRDLKVQMEPIQAGSGDPSPDNVRPISGRESVTVTRTGVNIWDEEWENGDYSRDTGQKSIQNQKVRNKNLIPVLPNTQYYAVVPTPPTKLNAYWYDAERTYISSETSSGIGGTFTTPDNCYFMAFSTFGTAYNTYNNDISINYPSTDHDYHAYQGQSIEIQLGQTVYGGTLDVTTGVLTVDKVCVDLSLPKNSFAVGTTSVCYRVNLASLANEVIYNQKHGAISNTMVEDTAYFSVSRPNEVARNLFAISAQGGILAVYDPDTSLSENAFLTKYANMHVLYPLATPITYQCTPTEVRTLLGINNIWSDADSVSVGYVADTKLYIEQLTEPDADMIADMNITSGRYFMVGNSLYLATANIANGAAITVGVNCTRTSLAEALNAINA